MQEKDFQINILHEELFRMKDQLIAANMDSDKVTVSALSEVSLFSLKVIIRGFNCQTNPLCKSIVIFMFNIIIVWA